MENGTYRYDLEMTTPLGRRRGSLELMVWDRFLNGYLTMFTRTIPIREGYLDRQRISFSGDMKTLLKMSPYQASGSLSPSGVELIISTEQGEYPVTGILTESKGAEANV